MSENMLTQHMYVTNEEIGDHAVAGRIAMHNPDGSPFVPGDVRVTLEPTNYEPASSGESVSKTLMDHLMGIDQKLGEIDQKLGEIEAALPTTP